MTTEFRAISRLGTVDIITVVQMQLQAFTLYADSSSFVKTEELDPAHLCMAEV